MHRLIRVPIQREDVLRSLRAPETGALVTFEGVVRNRARGKEVLFLEYDAYESMALKEMEAIDREARARWPIQQMAMIHRLGRLEIGECSVLIIATGAHRGMTFEACQFAIDTLKQRVPIWKKEHYADGELWIDGAASGI